jgi:hypothetical protein
MQTGSSLSSALLLPVVIGALTCCSNVTGNTANGDAGPGCPTNAVSDASGGAGDDGGGDDGGSSPCKPPDSDGITGGCYVFDLTVDDTGFSPIVLKAQNIAQVTITLKNVGSKPHDLAMGCVAISYPGCPPQFCFPPQANIASVPPGGSATKTFITPYVDDIYTFRSDLPGDSQVASDGGVSGLWGQFVVQ